MCVGERESGRENEDGEKKEDTYVGTCCNTGTLGREREVGRLSVGDRNQGGGNSNCRETHCG